MLINGWKFCMKNVFQIGSFICVAFLLAACGGGDSSPSSSGESFVTISGLVTYTSYKPNKVVGLDYGASQEKPIQGAVIELQNFSGNVLATGNTTTIGAYTLMAPANTFVRVVVKAALGNPSAPHTKIVDNTSDGALYAMAMTLTTGSSDVIQSFNANSGWGGAGYTGLRVAAPFAILGAIYQAQQLVLAVDSEVSFPPLQVNWSVYNKAASGDVTLGEIETSHYALNGQLYILGAANLDTDEYDSHIIVHEWGHYFEDKLSRSESNGGNHGYGDILDPTVAFSEGFSNALAGMAMNDPIYIDTSGFHQAGVGHSINLETDSVSETSRYNEGVLLDGFYAEASIEEVIYDIYDSGLADDDSIGLGFLPIYNVLINGQKHTPAFTSVFSFLHYLKLANPASSAAITDLALAENISEGDEYEATTSRFYTSIPFDGSIVSLDIDGDPLQTWGTFGEITPSSPGNKFYNRLFFKFTATSAGCYTFMASPILEDGDIIVYSPKYPDIDKFNKGPAESAARQYTLGEKGVFAVGSFGGETPFTVRVYSTPSAC